MPSKRAQRIWRKVQEEEQVRQEAAKKAVGYVRVSTEEQAATGYGLDAQERAIRAFAESQGYELVDVVADPGVSGASRPEKRPGFSRVLGLAQEGAFSVLLLWKFDRLARNLAYAVGTANALREQYGVVIRSVTEPIDTSTPMGETILAVLAGMAAQEREAITERTLAGKKEKARRGGFAGGAAPLGYRRDKEGGLEVDPEEAELVRRIHAMRKQGMSYRAIADTLNAEGAPTKRGGKWYPATIAYILDNRKYEGLVEYVFRWRGKERVEQEAAHEAILPKAG
ncbi:MAG: recombinase family protein [Bacillota bacterium]